MILRPHITAVEQAAKGQGNDRLADNGVRVESSHLPCHGCAFFLLLSLSSSGHGNLISPVLLGVVQRLICTIHRTVYVFMLAEMGYTRTDGEPNILPPV